MKENPFIIGNDKFKIVSVAPLFSEAVYRIHERESVSTLFSTVPQKLKDDLKGSCGK
ncbi:MAG: hypothetical protein RR873_06300 [Christensenella sp.]